MCALSYGLPWRRQLCGGGDRSDHQDGHDLPQALRATTQRLELFFSYNQGTAGVALQKWNGGGGGRQVGSSCVVAGTIQITKTDMICPKHYEPPPKGKNTLFSYNQGTVSS